MARIPDRLMEALMNGPNSEPLSIADLKHYASLYDNRKFQPGDLVCRRAVMGGQFPYKGIPAGVPFIVIDNIVPPSLEGSPYTSDSMVILVGIARLTVDPVYFEEWIG